MTQEQIAATAREYLTRLKFLGAEPIRMANLAEPYSLGTDDFVKNHLAWMCEHILKENLAGNTPKALHWLGFVQGVLYMLGEYSIDDFRTIGGVRSVP